MSKPLVGAKALTAVSVRAVKASATRQEIPDAACAGLYLVVQSSGHKSWALRFRRPDGRPAKLTLGPYTEHDAPGEPAVGGPLTLAAARQLATKAHRQRAHGHDPAAARQRDVKTRRDAVGTTFSAVALRFIEEHARPKTRRWHETARIVGFEPNRDLALIPAGLAQRWRDRPIGEITADDLHALVREVGARGVPGAKRRTKGRTASRARAMRATLSVLFGWLVTERVIANSPIAGVGRPDPPNERERTLTDDEIRALWKTCDAIGAPFGPLYKFLLLTGQRRDEAAEMVRAELKDGIWTIPPSRTKNGLQHVLPLSGAAMDLLEHVPRIAPETYIFTTLGSRPVSGFSRVKARVDSLMKPETPWWVHDLRRTAATGMARAGVDVIVIERVLNHVSGSFAGIVGTYQRHKYLDEMNEALNKWAKLIAEITDH